MTEQEKYQPSCDCTILAEVSLYPFKAKSDHVLPASCYFLIINFYCAVHYVIPNLE